MKEGKEVKAKVKRGTEIDWSHRSDLGSSTLLHDIWNYKLTFGAYWSILHLLSKILVWLQIGLQVFTQKFDTIKQILAFLLLLCCTQKPLSWLKLAVQIHPKHSQVGSLHTENWLIEQPEGKLSLWLRFFGQSEEFTILS